MMRKRIVFGLFGAALLSGIAFTAISNATLVPIVAQGTGPDSVQVTTSGWLALLISGLGTGGFTLAGIGSVVASRLGILLTGSPENVVSELVELSTAFAALMSDRTNRAAQRRFFFALVDSAQFIQGCQTSHEAGVVVIKYSGYATPVIPSVQGTKP